MADSFYWSDIKFRGIVRRITHRGPEVGAEQMTDREKHLEAILDRISEISGQPFTETHEHLPAWIETILRTRPDYAFKEGVKAARELDNMRGIEAQKEQG